MTIKTFQSITNPDTTFRVRGFGDSCVELFHRNGGITLDSLIARSDAPALALAILEAAGVDVSAIPSAQIGTSEHLSDTAYELSTYIEKQRQTTAEAEAQAKLEAEALELFNAAIRQEDGAIYDSFSQVPTPDLWLAVARRAREINKEENNA